MTTKIAVVGCIHNDIESLPTLLDKIFSYKPDILVSCGDVTDRQTTKGFSPKDIGKIFLEEIRLHTKNILIVPGTWDKDLIDLWDKEKVSLHGNGKVIRNIGFYGFGGAKTPFSTPFEPEEEEIENGLTKAFDSVKTTKIKIQVTHAPPFQTTLDIVAGKHVGSLSVRKAVEKFQPNVAVCSHIHEAMGKDFLGKTILLNVGKLVDGYFGFIEIKDIEILTDIINLT